MTRASIREHSEAVRWRYLQAPKKEKGKILDECTKVTDYHRKAIIRLLHRGNQPYTDRKRGRPRQYSAAVVEALRIAWEATDRLCSKRLHPFLPELVKILRRHSESTLGSLTLRVWIRFSTISFLASAKATSSSEGLAGMMAVLPCRAQAEKTTSTKSAIATSHRIINLCLFPIISSY